MKKGFLKIIANLNLAFSAFNSILERSEARAMLTGSPKMVSHVIECPKSNHNIITMPHIRCRKLQEKKPKKNISLTKTRLIN